MINRGIFSLHYTKHSETLAACVCGSMGGLLRRFHPHRGRACRRVRRDHLPRPQPDPRPVRAGRTNCANKLAHAELNVLLQVGIGEAQKLPECTLSTTTEPGVLCFGAIVMAGVRRVRYATADTLAGGADLNRAGNRFVASRKIDMRCEHGFLAVIQKVLRTDYLLGLQDKELAERLLVYEIAEYSDAVEH